MRTGSLRGIPCQSRSTGSAAVYGLRSPQLVSSCKPSPALHCWWAAWNDLGDRSKHLEKAPAGQLGRGCETQHQQDRVR